MLFTRLSLYTAKDIFDVLSSTGICLTSASARNSELQRIDGSSLIFQLTHIYIYYFSDVRSRSRDISTSLWRTSGTKLSRLEGFKMLHAK